VLKSGLLPPPLLDVTEFFFGLINKWNILSSLNVIHLGFRLFCFSPGVCFCLQGNEASSVTVRLLCDKQLKSHSQWLSLISYYHYRKSAATFFRITFFSMSVE